MVVNQYISKVYRSLAFVSIRSKLQQLDRSTHKDGHLVSRVKATLKGRGALVCESDNDEQEYG